MANIADCIRTAVTAGDIDGVRGEAAINVYEQLVRRYETIMPPGQARASAAADLKEATRKAARSRFHAVVNQLQAMRRLKARIEAAPDPVAVLRQMLEYSDGVTDTGESVVSLQNAYIRSINAGIAEALKRTGQDLLGRSRDRALLMDVVRELHAESTGNATAKRLAEAIRGQQQRMRRLFNAHGGDIGDLADYGVPHAHDARQLRKAGFEAWAAEVEVRLDWTRVIDASTGRPFSTDGKAPPRAVSRDFLKAVYDGIVTEGWNTRAPSMSFGGKALYNQRADQRQMHFKSGSDWIAYNERFGTSDPFSAMIGGLHGLARDVALMRVLGPNPKLGLEFAVQVAQKRAALAGDATLAERVTRRGKLVKTMLAHIDGSVNVPENEFMARFFAGTRKVLVSTHLGSALLSSTTDVAGLRIAAKIVGMNPNNITSRHTQLIASHATQETAAAMGYIADTLAQAGAASARYLNETMSPEITERLSSFTLRASGLSHWTDMARVAFQMEFSALLAQNAGRTFDQVDAPVRQLLAGRGITAADWDKLRAPAGLFTAPNGSTFLSPIYWRNHTDLPADEAEQLATRLQMLIEEQLERAVPNSSVEGRAYVLGESKPGTFTGEFLRSGAMFKNFALSLTINQYRRIMAQPTPIQRAKLAAKMVAMYTVMGALAVQLKEIAKGNDPRPMTTPAFWGAAFFQGGGVGIFGDFIGAQTDRFGNNLATTLAGPVAGLVNDVGKAVFSNVARAAQGEDTMLGRDAAKLVGRYTPVLSSLWPTRLAFQRLVVDELQELMDPEAMTEMRRATQRIIRERGTQPFIGRGDDPTFRLPDLGNALRTPVQ
jgi:PAS domain-containing protein